MAFRKVGFLLSLLFLVSLVSCTDHQESAMEKPEENRFVKVVLDYGLDEPMELAIARDGRIVFVERKGDIKLYDPKVKVTKKIGHLNVYHGFEDGLLGVTMDPDFMINGWLYFFYSPAGAEAIQRVTRIKMAGDSLIMNTEKILLKIPMIRETCCHSAGSLTFGVDNNLYIALGDNTSSKQSDGFTPIDERPGRINYDAQRSSGNTQDLRGKILRIHPEKDGTYTIPEGNLFPKDGSVGRPEIYIMGTRNPFRISTDIKNGWVFWGDVGPDGGTADPKRGPQSYDEFNLAKKAGYYGWPYFVGNNFAYRDFNFADSAVGKVFDPLHPENESPNNTGAKVLPPANPAWMWYPYGESKEFPLFGTGGRSAMAGPVYHYDDFKASPSRFPKYYDGKLFIYEWMRDWIIAVTIDKEGKIVSMEKFMPETKWDHPIELQLGPDGSMYLLEYGTNWFAENINARLVHIVYNKGNRAPNVVASISDSIGNPPLKVAFDALASSDLDKDSLTYAWSFDDNGATASTAKSSFVYEKPGIYYPRVIVKDANGDTASVSKRVIVGNTYPKVSIGINKGNQTFYTMNELIYYKAEASDAEDKNVVPSDIKVNLDFQEILKNKNFDPDKPIVSDPTISSNDCKACHAANKASVGPAFTAIANRYTNDKSNIDKLARKIITGGGGNWSEQHDMSAHPQLSMDEARYMVSFIFSYTGEKAVHITKTIPNEGSIDPKSISAKPGVYTLTATYTDRGYQNKYRLSSTGKAIVQTTKLEAENNDKANKADSFMGNKDGKEYYYEGGIRHDSYFMFKAIDLYSIKSVILSVNANKAAGTLEIRLDSPKGKLIGSGRVKPTGAWEDWYNVKIDLQATQGKNDIYIVYQNDIPKQIDANGMINIDWLEFQK